MFITVKPPTPASRPLYSTLGQLLTGRSSAESVSRPGAASSDRASVVSQNVHSVIRMPPSRSSSGFLRMLPMAEMIVASRTSPLPSRSPSESENDAPPRPRTTSATPASVIAIPIIRRRLTITSPTAMLITAVQAGMVATSRAALVLVVRSRPSTKNTW